MTTTPIMDTTTTVTIMTMTTTSMAARITAPPAMRISRSKPRQNTTTMMVTPTRPAIIMTIEPKIAACC